MLLQVASALIPSSPPDVLLARALELARRNASFASPNPAVGCVLVREGKILGEGAHRYDARDHAEIVALKAAASAGHSVEGATAFVTLEPCSHHGRTGPCCEALIAARIGRCVVATVDPNPAVSGRGIDRMRSAGILVDVLPPEHPIAEDARELIQPFAFAIQHQRPFVTLKAALSVDGGLAPAAHQRAAARAPHWLTGPAARADVQRLRHEADAVLTGIGTVLADDPALTDRTGQPRRRPLLRVVLDSRLRTPLASRLLRERSAAAEGESDLLILCADQAREAASTALQQAGAEVLRVPSSSGGVLDLRHVLAALQDRGLLGVLVEGGSTLNGALLRAGLVDRVVLYFAESELGPDALPFAVGMSPFELQQRLRRPTRTPFPHGEGEDIRIAGLLHDPWSGIRAT